jgi:hypothetical protein
MLCWSISDTGVQADDRSTPRWTHRPIRPLGTRPTSTDRPDLGPGGRAARNHYNGPAVDVARTVRP